MLELLSFLYSDPTAKVRRETATLWKRWGQQARFPHAHSQVHGSAMLLVLSDQPAPHCLFSNSFVTLICKADPLNAKRLSSGTVAGALAANYQERGDAFVKDLRGTFSIILFDHATGVLKAWVDGFGSGRLLFREGSDRFLVSSNLQLIGIHSEETLRVDPAAIVEYVQYSCIPAPRTIYAGTHRLEPGYGLAFKSGLKVSPYWNVHFDDRTAASATEQVWAEKTLVAVREAVRESTRVNDPRSVLGCFLSGGTDSSTVTGLMGQVLEQPVPAFSIGFDDPRYNEIGYARVAARHFRCQHHEFFVSPRDILSLARAASEAYDEPFGNSSIIPTYYCAKLAAEHGITHLLAGDGGDEIFGGNERYVKDRAFDRYDALPSWSRRRVLKPAISLANRYFPTRLVTKAANYVQKAELPFPERIFSYSLLATTERSELFAPGFLASCNGTDSLEAARRHYWGAPSTDPLNRWLYLDLKMTIGDNDLRKVTRMTELAGIQVRYPLLSLELAQFAGTIPPLLKVKKRQLRYLFKKAMSPILPDAIIKKSKHGFGLPFSIWVGEIEPLRDFTFDTLGSRQCRERGYFRRDLLEWIWQRYLTVHRQYYGEVLWVFLMLEMWHIAQNKNAASLAQPQSQLRFV